jgi:hypothetical protein
MPGRNFQNREIQANAQPPAYSRTNATATASSKHVVEAQTAEMLLERLAAEG